MANKIFEISHENILDHYILNNLIYKNMELNYYFSRDFKVDFYIDLALAGFISIWHKEDEVEYLLPEMQFEYAVLEFEELHISKKVKKLLNHPSSYSFFVDEYFEQLIKILSNHHKNSWIQDKYIELLKRLKQTQYKPKEFKLITFGIIDKNTSKIVAGEIGYITKEKIYTSLSGFSSRDKQFNNYGNLQLVLLAKYLQKNNFLFWNLGHPYMQYKLKLGAKVLNRKEFLEKFLI